MLIIIITSNCMSGKCVHPSIVAPGSPHNAMHFIYITLLKSRTETNIQIVCLVFEYQKVCAYHKFNTPESFGGITCCHKR